MELELDDLAREVAKVRAMRNLDPHPVHSLRRQIIDFEKGRRLPQHSDDTVADALQQDYDALFGVVIDAPLPRPLLLDTAVSPDVIAVIDAQRAAHVQVEHFFGPAYAHEFIDRDLSTIEGSETVIKDTAGVCAARYGKPPAASPRSPAGSPRTAAIGPTPSDSPCWPRTTCARPARSYAPWC